MQPTHIIFQSIATFGTVNLGDLAVFVVFNEFIVCLIVNSNTNVNKNTRESTYIFISYTPPMYLLIELHQDPVCNDLVQMHRNGQKEMGHNSQDL